MTDAWVDPSAVFVKLCTISQSPSGENFKTHFGISLHHEKLLSGIQLGKKELEPLLIWQRRIKPWPFEESTVARICQSEQQPKGYPHRD